MRKLISSFVFSILLLSGNGWGAIYYVDQTGGDDAKNGLSPAFAWKTIGKVNASYFAPGDSVLFKRGETWREQLWVSSSGSAGNPITIGVYGTGTKPTIQPTTQISSWTQVGATDIYYGSLSSAPTNVFINDSYCQPVHWPTVVGSSTPTFKYPSANSANSTHLTDSALHGIPEANLLGAIVNIYTNDYTQKNVVISAWDDTTHILTTGDTTTNPTTNMRYYLTAPPGTGIRFSNKSWMMSENTWFYDTDAQRLYVWKTGGGSPGTVEASTFPYAIIVSDKSFISIDGIKVRYAKTDGILIQAASNDVSGITVANCEANYNLTKGINAFATSGHTVSATITNNLVDHNGYSGITLDRPVNSSIGNNTVTYTNLYPILPSVAYPIIVSGSGATVSSNTVSYSSYVGISCIHADFCIFTNNNIDHTNTVLDDGGGIYFSYSTGNTISGNKLSGGTGYGIYLDEPTTNSTVELNSVIGGGIGILLHKVTGITIRKNVLNGPFTYAAGSRGAITISNYETNGTYNIYYNIVDCVDKNSSAGMSIWTTANSSSNIYNNDILNCSTGVLVHADVSNALENVSNNIFYNDTTNINASTGNITSIDHNLYYGAGKWIWGGVIKTTFNLWKAASSHDGASIVGDPLFISRTDFRLTEGSPARDAGTPVGVTSDFLGNFVPFGTAPDIGAYEYNSLPSKTPNAPKSIGVSSGTQQLPIQLVNFGFPLKPEE